jgi:hypothetical protein
MRPAASAPYENLRSLTRLHRVPATPEFDQAAEFMLLRAKEYGLHDAHAEQFPIDGKIHYGLMRSYLAWHVDSARLWELEPERTLLGDWATDPIRLADYSHSADVDAPLIDVGAGASEADYANKDVRGKIVLADGGARRSAAAGGDGARRGRDRERYAEPDHRVVRPGQHGCALGTSKCSPAERVCLYGVARNRDGAPRAACKWGR